MTSRRLIRVADGLRSQLALLLVPVLALAACATCRATAEPPRQVRRPPLPQLPRNRRQRLQLLRRQPRRFVSRSCTTTTANRSCSHAGREREDFGGVARFATVVADAAAGGARRAAAVCCCLSAGDNYRAGPEFSASLARRPWNPTTTSSRFDLIGYDAIVLGQP